MGVGTIIKRLFQAVGCLGLLVMFSFAGLSSYASHVERDPEARARLEAAGEAVEHKVDEDAGLIANLGVLISAWSNAEEYYEEKQREDALEAKARAERKRAVEEQRFNSTVPRSDNDYYAESTERN